MQQEFRDDNNGNISGGRDEDVFRTTNKDRREPSPPRKAEPEVPTEYAEGPSEQIECRDCGRRFNPGPYERHVKNFIFPYRVFACFYASS